MPREADTEQPKPLTKDELLDYLLYRYNLPSYQTHVQQWRESKRTDPDATRAGKLKRS